MSALSETTCISNTIGLVQTPGELGFTSESCNSVWFSFLKKRTDIQPSAEGEKDL